MALIASVVVRSMMNQFFNESEKFVYDFCRGSFLSLWSYANPLGKGGNELCDILLVCDPDIIIVSVKEIGFKNSGDVLSDWERWRKKAIEASVKQIYGAERWIAVASTVIRSDGSLGIRFPDMQVRRVHRIAVALGGEEKMPIHFGDFGKGFVHVFDKKSLQIIMGELNTVQDFIEYLSAKEDLYQSRRATVLTGGEEDLLAFYLHKGRQFADEHDLMVIGDDLWEGFSKSAEYQAKVAADESSYSWDRLIELLSKDIVSGNLEFGPELNDSEATVRIMARENRFSRRMLGKDFLEFYELARQKKVRSRMALAMSGVTYVFLALPHGEDRKYRVAELGGRCLVARGLHQDRKTVIGLATERYEKGKGFSFDIVYLHKDKWTEEDQKQMTYAQKEFGFFANPRLQKIHEDEYPSKS